MTTQTSPTKDARLAGLSAANTYRRIKAQCFPIFQLAAGQPEQVQEAATIISLQAIEAAVGESR